MLEMQDGTSTQIAFEETQLRAAAEVTSFVMATPLLGVSSSNCPSSSGGDTQV
jgi:hypothetical protein